MVIIHAQTGNNAKNGDYADGPDTAKPIFTRAESFEIFHGLSKLSTQNLQLREIIGPNGWTLATGEVSLGPEQARMVIPQLKEKRDAISFGWYDDYKGEIEVEGSMTQMWATRLDEIIRKLESITKWM